MGKKYLFLSEEEGRAMVTWLKQLVDTNDFAMPLANREEFIPAELLEYNGTEKDLVFSIINNTPKGFSFILETRYSRKILCMLHTHARHRNRDGNLINSPHLHVYEENERTYDAIYFGDYLKDTEKIGSGLIAFLKYCAVNNINDLSIEEDLL